MCRTRADTVNANTQGGSYLADIIQDSRVTNKLVGCIKSRDQKKSRILVTNLSNTKVKQTKKTITR